MTLMFKCDWCGKIDRLVLTTKKLTYGTMEYHYCGKCEKEVMVALSVGKNGRQGNYMKIAGYWSELHTALKVWATEAPLCRDDGGPDINLRVAINRFNRQIRELEGEK